MVRARRPSRLLAVGLGLTALVLVMQATDVLEPWELDTVDARFAIRGDEKPPPDLVTVLIDTRTFNGLPPSLARWPFRRIVHARVLDRVREDGVRAVAYDVQFTEPSERPDDDRALIEATSRLGGKIVLATTETNERGESRVFGGEHVLARIGARSGNAVLRVDSDGAIRRLAYETNRLKSLAIVGAEIVLGRAIDRAELPHDPAWIDYYGPPATIPSVSLSDVYLGNTKPGFFRNKVVVIGASAPSLGDVHETSTTGAGQLMSSPEIQANALATVSGGFPLSGTPRMFDYLLTIVAGLLMPVAAFRLSLRGTLILGVGAGLLLLIATQVAFHGGYVSAVLYPLLALILSTVSTITARPWT